MDALIVFLLWICSGVFGSLLTLEFSWRRGDPALDVQVGDLAFFGGMSLFGPFNLAVGVLFFAGWVLRKAAAAAGYDGSRVIFKAHRS